MEDISKAHRGRTAIRTFKTMADALALRGFYKPSGQSGKTLEDALRSISPEIYGSMNDPRCSELKGLEYVLDRLPHGIEACTRIVLTAREDLEETGFEKILPPKRRRLSYRVSDAEMCFVITRGASEIYDILTHITFLNIEARKIYHQMRDSDGEISAEWKALEKTVAETEPPEGRYLDQAIWNLSILLGRTYSETKATCEYLAQSRRALNSSKGLFQIVHDLGLRVTREQTGREYELLVYFTPALRYMMGHHAYSPGWALAVKQRLYELNLHERPLHIISANMHSVLNLVYAYAALNHKDTRTEATDLYAFLLELREHTRTIKEFAAHHGFYDLPDHSVMHIDCQIIDLAAVEGLELHPALQINREVLREHQPVLLIMDYGFGEQAFEIMDELLNPITHPAAMSKLDVQSVSVMGKAGILPGKKGDIMLASAHVMEGTPHNYLVPNELQPEDFDANIPVYAGPIITVLGTSLQNRDILEKFQETSWKAVGLEMEGGHYQRAISGAIIRGHISPAVKLRYAYYASDNPLHSGQTLASGSMGDEGIRPTYMITKVILEKIAHVAPTA